MTRAALRALLRRAVASLRAHALRSSLSILGILFGVASITAVSSVTEGARLEALAQIGDLGADTLVAKARPASGEAPPAELTIDDLARLRATLPGLVSLAPIRTRDVDIAGASGTVVGTVVGSSEDYARTARSVVARGRTLAALDVAEARRVAVIGAGLAAGLFPKGGALGGRIRVEDVEFDVIGVLEARAARRSASSGLPLLGRDLNRVTLVPWSAVPSPGGRETAIDEIVLRVSRPETAPPLAAATRRALETSLGRGTIDVIVPLEVLRQQQRTQTVFAVVTGATSLICLIVGGVGILNILLASVSERVREIGIRRAVGATREDIGAQFLAEGALLSGFGGVLGLILGGLASMLIQKWAGWPIGFAPLLVLGGWLASVAAGLIAGGYPAWRAAHLEVMDALRRN